MNEFIHYKSAIFHPLIYEDSKLRDGEIEVLIGRSKYLTRQLSCIVKKINTLNQ